MVLKKLEDILSLIESGDFVDVKEYMKDSVYGSEYKTIIEKIDLLSKMLGFLRNDSLYMSRNFQAGDLNLRIDTSKYFGSFNMIANGINDTIVQMSNILKNFGQNLNNFSNGVYSKLEADVYYGDFEIFQKSMNFLADELEKNHKKKIADKYKTDAIAKLNTILSGDLSLQETSNIALEFVCEYLNANAGSLYIYNAENNVFKITSAYSLSIENLPKNFHMGNGTIGVVGKQRAHRVTISPEEADLKIISSYGIQIPKCIYTFPLVFKGELAGVIEIGFSKILEDEIMEFIQELNFILSAFILSAIRNDKINLLLKESLIANERLEIQSEELQQTNTQLEEANLQMEEQQQQLEETNAQLEEQQQQIEEFSKSLQDQNKNLELSDKYKSEFLANMSHELRTPLNSVILLSEVLLDNKNKIFSTEDIKKLSIVHSAGNELLRLINDILDLSKIESGNMEVKPITVSTHSIIQEISSQFEFASSKQYIKFECIDNVKSNLVVDKDKLIQIIRNLLSNAFKFTTDGYIKFVIDKCENNKFVELYVEDSGIGIDNDKLGIIFDAFKQADGTTSRQFGGTGLGLSISKELANILLGYINVVSQKGKGSKFSIFIPINFNDVSAENIQILNATKKLNDQMSLAMQDDFHNLKFTDRPFLVILDDDRLSRVLANHIHAKNEKVVMCKNGKNALALLNGAINFSGILLDLILPDVDGVEILKDIKSNIKLADTPVYIISDKDKEYQKGDDLSNDRINVILDDLIKRRKLSNISRDKTKIDFMGKKILIVDDDERNLYILNEALSSRNATVLNASNGIDAIRKVNEIENIDLILMDIMMPIMDGYEAISKIKSSNKKHIPIIALTAKAMESDRKKCLEVGANDYISKPLNMDIFLKLVKAWL